MILTIVYVKREENWNLWTDQTFLCCKSSVQQRIVIESWIVIDNIEAN